MSLVISGEGSNRIYVFDNAASADGAVTPDQEITGASTNLVVPCDIGYDTSRKIIYTANWSGNSVVAHDDSTNPTGDVPSSRVIAGGMTGFGNLCGIEVDAANDRLFVGGNIGIAIYDTASTVNGDVAPDRLVAGANTLLTGNGEVRLFLDTSNDRMYVADWGNDQVLVFNNASTMDGNIAPNRIISGGNTTFNGPWGVFVDLGRNILYVGNQPGDILIFNNASTVDGNVAPSRAVSGVNTGFSEITDLVVDTGNNYVYVVDRSNQTVRIWHSASTIDGNLAPDRVITGLMDPNGIVGIYK